jgi:hypothetical protein
MHRPQGKKTMWEGGSRVVGLVSGYGIARGRVSHGLVYCADWLPTLVGLALHPDQTGTADPGVATGKRPHDAWRRLIPAGEPQFYPDLGDGIDLWSLLSGDNETSRRTEMLVETHATKNKGLGDALTVSTVGDGSWKILRQNSKLNAMWALEQGWFPPPGQDPTTTSYTLACGPPPAAAHAACNSTTAFCLFDMDSDPCEHHDVAAQHPAVVQRLVRRLAEYQATVDERICGRGADPEASDSNLCGCWPQMVGDGGLSAGGVSWAPCDIRVGPSAGAETDEQ